MKDLQGIHSILQGVPQMKNPGIYILTCKINEKQYVGLDSNLPSRIQRHLNQNTRECKAIHNAILKHGKENFGVQIISYPGISKEALKEIEKFKIAHLKTQSPDGYNLTAGGDGNLNYKPSPETRAKLSKAAKGKTRSAEHRANLSKANKGKKLSPETRTKISKANKGKNHPLYGKKHSPETRAKLSKSAKDRKHPPDIAAKMSKIRKGKKASPETRAKISKAQIGRIHSPETRAKMSRSKRRRDNATPKEQLTLFHLF